MKDSIQQLQTWIDQSHNIVFFGGAGVSTESGMKDFRSQDGLYKETYQYPPEMILSHQFFSVKTKEFYQFYRKKMDATPYEPNVTHRKLAELEQAGKLKKIITQNIDGLHQKAGSKNVIELHGSIYRNYCMKCHQFHDEKSIFASQETIPRCSQCGGIIKPDVVLYGESLDDQALSEAINAIRNCDLFIVGGTSLTVYPARNLIDFYEGDRLVLINKDTTPYDRRANLMIPEKLGTVFSKIHV